MKSFYHLLHECMVECSAVVRASLSTIQPPLGTTRSESVPYLCATAKREGRSSDALALSLSAKRSRQGNNVQDSEPRARPIQLALGTQLAQTAALENSQDVSDQLNQLNHESVRWPTEGKRAVQVHAMDQGVCYIFSRTGKQ